MLSIAINGVEIMEVSDFQLQIAGYSAPKEQIQNIISRLIANVVSSQLGSYGQSLQNDWVPKIRQRYASMPTADQDIANLIFSQKDYQDYDTRNQEQIKQP